MKETIYKITDLLFSESVYDFRATALYPKEHVLITCYCNYTEEGYEEVSKKICEKFDVFHTEYDHQMENGKFRIWIAV